MRADPAEFELASPGTLAGALRALRDEPGIWTPIAGGTELMVLLSAGRLRHRRFLDLWNLPELRRIDVGTEGATLGAGCTFTDLRRHAALAEAFPLLAQSASWTGSVANQNRGTLGGNVVNASPAADTPPALLAYGAELELVSASASRRIPIAAFYRGYKRIDLAADELLFAIHLPRRFEGYRQTVRKVGARNAQAVSKVALAGVGRLVDGLFDDVRIGVASLAPVPYRLQATETFLRGKPLDDATLREARNVFLEEISPIDDIRSTAVYRAAVGANLLEEFLRSLGKIR